MENSALDLSSEKFYKNKVNPGSLADQVAGAPEPDTLTLEKLQARYVGLGRSLWVALGFGLLLLIWTVAALVMGSVSSVPREAASMGTEEAAEQIETLTSENPGPGRSNSTALPGGGKVEEMKKEAPATPTGDFTKSDNAGSAPETLPKKTTNQVTRRTPKTDPVTPIKKPAAKTEPEKVPEKANPEVENNQKANLPSEKQTKPQEQPSLEQKGE